MGLSDFLTQSASISAPSGVDGTGARTFGAAVEVDCKFRKQYQMMGDAREGLKMYEDVPDAVMYVKRTVSVDTDDSVAFDGEDYRVVDILDQVGTVTSLKHKKVLLKKYA